MMNLKVLMIGSAPSVKGGITSVISQLLKHNWKADGIEMKFISTYIETDNLRKLLYFMAAYGRILYVLRKEKPDVVHMHMSYKGSFMRKYAIHRLCKKYGIKDIVHLHGSEFERWYHNSDSKTRFKIRRLLRECGALIVLGKKWEQAVKRIEPQTKTIVASNTVHIPKETVSWNDDCFQVLFSGVLIERKGVSDLLEAVRMIRDQGRIGKIHFVIAGNGKEEQKLKGLSEQYDLKQYVSFAGWVEGERKCSLLRTSQLLVLPSYHEGLPVAILEAISYGLPVVASDVGDVSSAVINGRNGYLIAPGDYETLAKRILNIAENRPVFEIMSEESKKLAGESFSDEKYFEKIKSCYVS